MKKFWDRTFKFLLGGAKNTCGPNLWRSEGKQWAFETEKLRFNQSVIYTNIQGNQLELLDSKTLYLSVSAGIGRASTEEGQKRKRK